MRQPVITSQDREIQALVNDIREGRLLLPELQRGYVWKSAQVRNLFDSLYRNYPSGQILVWETDDLPHAKTVSVAGIANGHHLPQLLLDGQQRLTSLSAVMLGRELRVLDDTKPIDIVFNVHTERFEVAGPRQHGESGWISLTKLFTQGQVQVLSDLNFSFADPDAKQIMPRLARLENIRTYKYRVNVLEQLDYEEVTDIFIRINSGGTVLNNADLALAQISSRWRGVTQELSSYQEEVKNKYGIWLDSGILLRALSLLLTGQSSLSHFFRGERRRVTVDELEGAWNRVCRGMNQAFAFLTENCRIDRLSFLPTNHILITLAAYFDRFNENIGVKQIRDLQRWVYLALIWSRYSSASETALGQDYAALSKGEPISVMIQSIEDKSGRLAVSEREMREQRKNSPFLLMSYVLARYSDAQDWFNGMSIGGSSKLELHHIFPKAILRQRYQLRKDSRTVDQVANLAFLSKRPSISATRDAPADYLSKLDEGRLRAQAVPLDPTVWTLEQFEEFALRRRQILADGINKLIASLTDNPVLVPQSDIELLNSRIKDLERELRSLVADRLTEARGDGALEHCVPKDIRNGILKRRDQHLAKNPFDADKLTKLGELLQFCQFSDYAKIMKENWRLFSDVFGDGKSFEQHIAAVTNARNAFAHDKHISKPDLLTAEAGLVWVEHCLVQLRPKDEEADGADADDVDEVEGPRIAS